MTVSWHKIDVQRSYFYWFAVTIELSREINLPIRPTEAKTRGQVAGLCPHPQERAYGQISSK